MNCVAVIIPVYNAADTLHQLLESLRVQTFHDFIAIFVDDGSLDNSRDMVLRAAENDERFILIECLHGGPGVARNMGMDKAESLGVDFITFLDADDLITPNALETAIRILDESGADIVHYPWRANGSNRKQILPSIYVWNKTYRRSAIEGIRFIRSSYAEDLAFFIETEARMPKRIECSEPLYIHIKRNGSLWEERSPEDMIQAMNCITSHLSRFFSSPSSATSPVAKAWHSIYLPKMLKNWWRAIQQLPRPHRKKARVVFVDRVRALNLSGQFTFFQFRGFRFRMKCLTAVLFAPVLKAIRCVGYRVHTVIYHRRYANILKRLRERCGPVKVLFLVSEISKWKTRSLFELMVNSPEYSPVIGVSLDDSESRLPEEERNSLLERRMKWFLARSMACVPVFDVKRKCEVDLRDFSPDVVFYQQPWQILKIHRPEVVSRFALTCYVPYCMADFGNLEAECLMPFFSRLFVYFVQSASWASLYRSATNRMSCRFVTTGHPVIDEFRGYGYGKRHADDGCIIYAPHWTFRCPARNDLYPYGTFNGNGREILAYAKSHPEWHWVFKPHPLLREALVKRGLMTNVEVDEYYAEWEKLGTVCYDADYPRLFMESRAMITDSGSFLVEYGVTCRPLIHLIPYDSSINPLPPNRELFASYYRVTSLDAMYAALSVVLERGEDPLYENRCIAAKKAGLFSGNASKRILRYLSNILNREKEGQQCRD